MIVVKNLTKSIAAKVIFSDISFVWQSGDRVGLIGPNGCGKSTLLKILVGETSADGGEFNILKERIGYLPQKIEVTGSVREYLKGFDRWRLAQVLKQVGLSEKILTGEVAKLSGGQKTRLALAKILLVNPTVIVLDEPTNHLDLEGINWLEELLKQWRGGILVVSHDRAFLDNVVGKIWELDPVRGGLFEYVGGYSQYVESKKIERERWEIDYKVQQSKKKKMEAWIVRKRVQASAHPSPAAGRQLHQMERRLQREILDQLIMRPQDCSTIRRLMLTGRVHQDKLVLRLQNVVKSFGQRRVLNNINLEVRGPERILFSGPNGVGKSTLLKIIVGVLPADSGEVKVGENMKIGYFAQEQEVLDTTRSVIENYLMGRELDITQSQARHDLGAFKFSDDDVYKKVATLSYGERVRLILARLSSEGNQLLVLDEPTNHLDIAAREIVEAALREYQGALLLVSHDRYFVERIGLSREVRIGGRSEEGGGRKDGE